MLGFWQRRKREKWSKENKDRNPRRLKRWDTQELLSELHPHVIAANMRNLYLFFLSTQTPLMWMIGFNLKFVQWKTSACHFCDGFPVFTAEKNRC